MTNVVVAGLPRSGSTLVSALIDYLPDSVCLNSPAWQLALAHKLPEAMPFCKWLIGDFVWARRQLLNCEPMIDWRGEDGTPLLDTLNDPKLYKKAGEPNPVLFTRTGLSDHFLLGMKQHTLYTGVLPTLVQFKHFTIIAVIRNPIDVILSWQKLPQPIIAADKPHGIARFWPEALAITNADIDPTDRLVHLYDIFLQRYHELRDQIHIVKYEDILEDPMLVSRLVSRDSLSAATSLIRPPTRLRSSKEADTIKERFRKYGVYTKLYYPNL